MLTGLIKILRSSVVYRLFCLMFCFLFVFSGLPAFAQAFDHAQGRVLPYMPPPGQMITPADRPYDLPYIVGMRFSSDNIFEFTFFLNRGNVPAKEDVLRREVEKVGKYFLAALTIPEKDLWVNLSPYEQDRVVTPELGRTDLGKDLLGEDYVLKQLASSLTHPDSESGKQFWGSIYSQAQKKMGNNAQIPVNTFNKVWIIPDKIKMEEASDRVVIKEATLKVLTDEDYLAMQKNGIGANNNANAMRDVIVPLIEKEVNTGKHFAYLRQVYRSIILAGWFKKKLKDTILGQVYFNQKKTQGAQSSDPALKEKIYNEYVSAFKKGVYNVIKSERVGMRISRRQYFSGGMGFDRTTAAEQSTRVPPGRVDAGLAVGNLQAVVAGRGVNTAGADMAFAAGAAKDARGGAVAPLRQHLELYPMGERGVSGSVSNTPPLYDRQYEQFVIAALVRQWTKKLVFTPNDKARVEANIKEGIEGFMALYADAPAERRYQIAQGLSNGTANFLDNPYFGIDATMTAQQITQALDRSQNFLDAKKALGVRWAQVVKALDVRDQQGESDAEEKLARAIYRAHAGIPIAGLTPGSDAWRQALREKTSWVRGDINDREEKILLRDDVRILMDAAVLGRGVEPVPGKGTGGINALLAKFTTANRMHVTNESEQQARLSALWQVMTEAFDQLSADGRDRDNDDKYLSFARMVAGYTGARESLLKRVDAKENQQAQRRTIADIDDSIKAFAIGGRSESGAMRIIDKIRQLNDPTVESRMIADLKTAAEDYPALAKRIGELTASRNGAGQAGGADLANSRTKEIVIRGKKLSIIYAPPNHEGHGSIEFLGGTDNTFDFRRTPVDDPLTNDQLAGIEAYFEGMARNALDNGEDLPGIRKLVQGGYSVERLLAASEHYARYIAPATGGGNAGEGGGVAGVKADGTKGGFDFATTQDKNELTVTAGGLKLSGDKAAAYLSGGKLAGFKLAILALRY